MLFYLTIKKCRYALKKTTLKQISLLYINKQRIAFKNLRSLRPTFESSFIFDLFYVEDAAKFVDHLVHAVLIEL